jgi:hypothetical protein
MESSLIGMIAVIGMPMLYAWLQWRAVKRLGWRLSALAPLLLVLAMLGYAIVGVAYEQNLAPLFLFLSLPFAVAWLAIAEFMAYVRS